MTDTRHTARLARRRSAANLDRRERKHVGHGSRASYSARRAHRAERQIVRATLRTPVARQGTASARPVRSGISRPDQRR